VLAVIAIVPGFPFAPFALLAVTTGSVAYVTTRHKADAAAPAAASIPDAPAQPDSASSMKEILQVEPLEVELGYGLVPLVDSARQGDLLQRIGIMRKQLALELGIVIPPARIRDNIQLPASEYVIKLRGTRTASGEILPRYLLALEPSGGAQPIEGIRTVDPGFGLPAIWIAPEQRLDAEAAGYSVVEPSTVLATHLLETIRRNAAELLSRQAVRELLDTLKETHPALVEDVVPGKLPLGTVHRVLQRLLREGVPIRDLVLILESLADAAEQTKDPEILTEHVRRALSGVLLQLYADDDGSVRGITVGPRLEASLMTLFSPRAGNGTRTLDPDELAGVLRSLDQLARQARRDGQQPPLIASPALRVGIRRLIEPVMPALPVISLGELPPQTPIHSLATWELRHAA
jgi:flagellar biosynthesis protein FlhA